MRSGILCSGPITGCIQVAPSCFLEEKTLFQSRHGSNGGARTLSTAIFSTGCGKAFQPEAAPRDTASSCMGPRTAPAIPGDGTRIGHAQAQQLLCTTGARGGVDHAAAPRTPANQGKSLGFNDLAHSLNFFEPQMRDTGGESHLPPAVDNFLCINLRCSAPAR